MTTSAGLTFGRWQPDAATDSMLDSMKVAVEQIALPEKIARAIDPNSVIAGTLEICRNRISAFD
jgi:hypothetical protein